MLRAPGSRARNFAPLQKKLSSVRCPKVLPLAYNLFSRPPASYCIANGTLMFMPNPNLCLGGAGPGPCGAGPDSPWSSSADRTKAIGPSWFVKRPARVQPSLGQQRPGWVRARADGRRRTFDLPVGVQAGLDLCTTARADSHTSAPRPEQAGARTRAGAGAQARARAPAQAQLVLAAQKKQGGGDRTAAGNSSPSAWCSPAPPGPAPPRHPSPGPPASLARPRRPSLPRSCACRKASPSGDRIRTPRSTGMAPGTTAGRTPCTWACGGKTSRFSRYTRWSRVGTAGRGGLGRSLTSCSGRQPRPSAARRTAPP